MSEERFEVLDESGRPIGVAPRSEVHAKGLWHRAAHGRLAPDGVEVAQVREIGLPALKAEMRNNPGAFTPWFLNCATKLLGV